MHFFKELLAKIVSNPEIIDYLFEIKLTDNHHDINSIRRNTLACGRLEAIISDYDFDESVFEHDENIINYHGRNNDIFLDFHYNYEKYIKYLHNPEKYPITILNKLKSLFPLFKSEVEHEIPEGYKRTSWGYNWLKELLPLKEVGFSKNKNFFTPISQIAILRPVAIQNDEQSVDLLFPWQVGISSYFSNYFNSCERLETKFSKINNRYSYQLRYNCMNSYLPFRASVALILEGNKVQYIFFSTRSILNEMSAFENFLNSIKG